MTDSDAEEEEVFPTSILKVPPRMTRGQLLNMLCHSLLKLFKLFTAISLSVMLIFEDNCGTLMIPLLSLISLVLYSDVVMYAMVPICFNHCRQTWAMNFYHVYQVMKWILRVSLILLGVSYNIFVFSSYNHCPLGDGTEGSILLAILVAIDFCLMVYCSFVSVVLFGLSLTMMASR